MIICNTDTTCDCHIGTTPGQADDHASFWGLIPTFCNISKLMFENVCRRKVTVEFESTEILQSRSQNLVVFWFKFRCVMNLFFFFLKFFPQRLILHCVHSSSLLVKMCLGWLQWLQHLRPEPGGWASYKHQQLHLCQWFQWSWVTTLPRRWPRNCWNDFWQELCIY